MKRGSLPAEIKFPVGSRVTVKRISTGTMANVGDIGTVITKPYQWFASPGSGPRQCVVIDVVGLSKQVRTKDLKADPILIKRGLPA